MKLRSLTSVAKSRGAASADGAAAQDSVLANGNRSRKAGPVFLYRPTLTSNPNFTLNGRNRLFDGRQH
jgi:hypothetical protein